MSSKISDRLPKMRLTKPWRQYPVGAVIQPPGTLRQVLQERGIGEVIDEPAKESAEPVVEETPETPEAPEPVKKKRRGRPKKDSTVEYE
jgi:hypothetical protein